jgi:hypothetical protein
MMKAQKRPLCRSRSERPAAQFIRVEDRRGRLLFEYDPQRHLVRIKTRSMDRPELVDLAQYRAVVVDETRTAVLE